MSGQGGGPIDWGSDWDDGGPKGLPPPEPPEDTPPLEFRPVHAAIPSLSEPFANEDEAGLD